MYIHILHDFLIYILKSFVDLILVNLPIISIFLVLILQSILFSSEILAYFAICKFEVKFRKQKLLM